MIRAIRVILATPFELLQLVLGGIVWLWLRTRETWFRMPDLIMVGPYWLCVVTKRTILGVPTWQVHDLKIGKQPRTVEEIAVAERDPDVRKFGSMYMYACEPLPFAPIEIGGAPPVDERQDPPGAA